MGTCSRAARSSDACNTTPLALYGGQLGVEDGSVNGPSDDVYKKLVLDAQLDSRHTFINMPEFQVSSINKTLCRPALGYSFAAGTTDGPGMFFEQATSGTGDPFWNEIRRFIQTPSSRADRVSAPKAHLARCGREGAVSVEC